MLGTTHRLHPLIVGAAVSVIVLSGAGVAALTGLLPTSKGQQEAQKGPGQIATVESVREVTKPGEAQGVGAVAGGVVGGLVGNELGHGKPLGTIAGAAGGAFAGHQIERHARSEKRWVVALRMEDGTQRTVSSRTPPAWRAGDRVRLVDGRLQAI